MDKGRKIFSSNSKNFTPIIDGQCCVNITTSKLDNLAEPARNASGHSRWDIIKHCDFIYVIVILVAITILWFTGFLVYVTVKSGYLNRTVDPYEISQRQDSMIRTCPTDQPTKDPHEDLLCQYLYNEQLRQLSPELRSMILQMDRVRAKRDTVPCEQNTEHCRMVFESMWSIVNIVNSSMPHLQAFLRNFSADTSASKSKFVELVECLQCKNDHDPTNDHHAAMHEHADHAQIKQNIDMVKDLLNEVVHEDGKQSSSDGLVDFATLRTTGMDEGVGRVTTSIGERGNSEQSKVSSGNEGSSNKYLIGNEGVTEKSKVSIENEGNIEKSKVLNNNERDTEKSTVLIGNEGVTEKSKVLNNNEGNAERSTLLIRNEGVTEKSKVLDKNEGNAEKSTLLIRNEGITEKSKVSSNGEGNSEKSTLLIRNEGITEKSKVSSNGEGNSEKSTLLIGNEGVTEKSKVSSNGEGNAEKSTLSIRNEGITEKSKVSSNGEGNSEKSTVLIGNGDGAKKSTMSVRDDNQREDQTKATETRPPTIGTTGSELQSLSTGSVNATASAGMTKKEETTTQTSKLEDGEGAAVTANVMTETDGGNATEMVNNTVHPSVDPSGQGHGDRSEQELKGLGGTSKPNFRGIHRRIVSKVNMDSAPGTIPTAETIKSSQQLQLSPSISWVPYQVCFYGSPPSGPMKQSTSPGQIMYPGSSSGGPYPFSMPQQRQGYQNANQPPNYVQVQAQSVQFFPAQPYPGNAGQSGQKVGPTGPAYPMFPGHQASPSGAAANYNSRTPYYCTYIPAPTFQFPAIPGVTDYQRSSAGSGSKEEAESVGGNETEDRGSFLFGEDDV